VIQGASVLFVVTVLARAHRRGEGQNVGQAEAPHPWGLWGSWRGGLVWLTTLAVGFVSDDFIHMYHVEQGYFSELATLFVEGPDRTFMRPLGFISIVADHALWDRAAAGYHFTNVLLHLISVVGFYALNRSWHLEKKQAAFIAGLYACMPIQVEAVAWMGARFDLLAGAFTMWALVFYSWFRLTGRHWNYVAALILFLLAMFSKESGFVLPLLVVAMEWCLLRPRRFRMAAVLFCFGTLAFVCRLYFLGGIGGYATDGIPSALNVDFKTMEGLILHGPAQLLTGLNWTQPPDWISIALGSLWATTLIVVALGTAPSLKTRRYLKFGVLWALFSMLPVHFLLMVGPSLTNSRALYMATAGTALVLGYLLLDLPDLRIRNAAGLAMMVLLPLGTLHNIRAWLWTSDISAITISEVLRQEPSPPPGAELVFVNAPDTIRGVFFFHVGWTEAFRSAYGRNDLSARRAEEPSTNAGEQIRFVWTGAPGKPVEKAE
jgi:hypothetical protein